ncbi:ATP-binding protein [Roseomonas chloroacetimidivorans]|uniref:ATP-binding protein n=1 Tax=Roseomonas chloroacetimidivorans TaxID=1766656 RepID=UPI003C7258A0
MGEVEESDSRELLRQQTALAQFGELALKSDDLDGILTEACRLVGEALGTDLAKVMELQEDGETLFVRAGVGWKPGVVGKVTIKVSDDTSEGYALKTGGPMISSDIAEETRFSYPPFLVENGVKAVANVPIIGAECKPPFGILQIDSREPRQFTENDTAFLRTYANLLAVVVDRLRATGDLRDSEARLRSLVEGIPQFVFRSRGSGERIWGSPQWVAYSGLSEAASLGLGWLDVIHPDDRAATMAAWAEAEARGLFSVEHRTYHAADRTWRWFQSRATPVRDPEGRILEWVGTSTDIDDQVRAREVLARSREELEAQVAERTAELRQALDSLQAEMAQREHAEEQLRQAQKMEAVGQLTGGIAHDFNNMLQGIAGGMDMARRRIGEGRAADALHFLDLTRQSVSRAAGLTRRLLAFARRQRLEPKLVDPDALVAGMADLIRRTVGPSVRLDLHLRDGRARVLCDPTELESALLNLCINARDAMPEGGRLTIGTDDIRLSAADLIGQEGAAPGDYVAISVSDTGVGMSADVVDRVFEPFFTTKPLGQGTGLGLSQVYGFVRQSGGIVRLESAPGKGTTLRLVLPHHAQAAVAERTSSGAPGPDEAVHAHTVLLVDDEEVAREVMAERLRELGYRVLEAADGPAALHLLDGGAQIDMLVTDVGLPNGMNGRQVAEAVRERRPGIPLLFITGYAGTDLAAGSDVIDKPFDLDTLARRVQAALARH